MPSSITAPPVLMIKRLYQILSFDTIQQEKILKSPVRLVTQSCQIGTPTEYNSVGVPFVELYFGNPNKRLKNFPAVFISVQGHLRVPLDRPNKSPVKQIHRLDETVRAAGHLCKTWRQVFDCLVVVAVDAQLCFLQRGSQGRTYQDARHVGGLVIRRLHGMHDF